MMTSRMLLAMAAGLIVLCAACGLGGFNEGRCRNSIEASPVRLDGEQVMLNSAQLDCGVHNDLWDAPHLDLHEQGTARLQEAGRTLKFDDDIQINQPGLRQPYVQIRGEFPLQVLEIVSIRDGEDDNVKLIEVRLGIVIQHTCFPQPIPLMGVKKGKFTQDNNPIVRLKQTGTTWFVDRLVH
jgi:hypothetical protein